MRKHCRCYVALRPLLLLLMILLPLLAFESGLHIVDRASVSGKFSYLNASLNRTEILPTVTLYKHLLHFSSFVRSFSVDITMRPSYLFFYFLFLFFFLFNFKHSYLLSGIRWNNWQEEAERARARERWREWKAVRKSDRSKRVSLRNSWNGMLNNFSSLTSEK